MFEKTFVGQSVDDLKVTRKFEPFSKVILKVDDETTYTSGDESGRTITVNCPWGTQEIADRLMRMYKGFAYQPYEASKARVDPAAEIGDGVSMGRIYGGLYRQDINFDYSFTSDIAAPQDEQINHEFPQKSHKDRETQRFRNQTRSTLKVQAGLIAAKVEQVGGDKESFAWELKADHHSWFANGTEVVRFEKDNFLFRGRVEAIAGLIGGLTLEDGYMHTGDATDYFNVQPGEMFIGPIGINLGGNFKVNSQGELVARTGKFEGTIYAGNVAYGDKEGYFNGAGLSSQSVFGGSGGKISLGTITTSNTVSAINSALANGDYAADVLYGNSTPENDINFSNIRIKGLYWRGKQVIQEASTGYLKVTK